MRNLNYTFCELFYFNHDELKQPSINIILLCVKLTISIFLLFFIFFSYSVRAETIRLFDAQTGVGNAIVNAFAQDSNGFLYVGTTAGLYVSSGGEFTRVDNENNAIFKNVTALAGGSDGSLLVGADNALWMRTGFSFHKVPLKLNAKLQFSVLGKDFIVLVGEGAAKGGGLWRIHHDARKMPVVERFEDDTQHVPILLGNPLTTLSLHVLSSSEETLWIACGRALCRNRDGSTVVFGTREGIPADEWLALTIAPDGTLIARSAIHFVRISVDKDIDVEDIPTSSSRSSTSSFFLIATQSGSVITQENSSLLIRSSSGQWKSTNFLSKHKLGSVSSAFIDREEGIWLASPNHGIMRLAGFSVWENYGTERGFPATRISAIRRDNFGAFWLATEQGLFHYSSHDNGDDIKLPIGHYNIDVRSLLRTGDGTIWGAGKSSGLVRINPETGNIITLPSQASLTGAMALDSAGRLWIGTAQGIVRIDDPLHPPSRLSKALVLNDRRINALQFDQFGRLLALTDNVLFRQKPGEDYFEPQIDLIELGIGDGRLMTVTMSNEVWVAGIRGGLRKIELREEGSAILSSFSRNAPYIEVVTSLFRDTRGWIWIGSSRGLNVLTSSGWRHFDVNSGLISNHIIYGAINEDDDGSLWFGTDSGMSHLTAEHIFPALPELHTCITSAYINSVNLLGNPRIWSDGERNLSVNFVAPTFVGSNDLNYRYILENVDTAPHTENETFANYSNVQGQQISFDVQAIDFINARSANHAHLAAHMGSGLGRSSRFLIAFVSCGFLFFLISGGSYRRYVMVRQKNIDRAVRDRTRVMEEIQAQLRQQSRVDGLTGLLNRRTALDELSYLISSLAPGELIAVSLIDIDHFKLINDTFGHQAGDFVLEQYGLRLRQTSGPGVMAGRYGGEELIIIYPIVRKIQSVIEEANTLHRVLCMPIRVEESIVVATCSIGLAIISPGDTPESLIGRADRALYKGKRGGRNCLIIAD